MQKKVVVAVSGGVDSSVAAFLLQKKSFRVELVFGLFVDKTEYSEIERIKNLAKRLKVSFKIIDLRKKFKNEVINYFLNTYQSGLTPNPCVICNQKIKFKELFKVAGRNDLFATGHYARIKKIGRNYFIFRGQDPLKDQSYFLWQIDKKILPRLIFPLGDLTKKEVKKIAQKEKIIGKDTSESNDICFAPQISLFLKKNLPQLAEEGGVLNLKGRIIGSHQGIIFYTIGQRGGFEIDKTKMNQPKSLPPLYVQKIKPLKNQIVIAPRKYLYQRKIQIKNLNLFCDLPQKFQADVQIRYGHKSQIAKIRLKNRTAEIIFDKLIFAPTPGQSAVIYQKDKLLAGGIIKS